MTDLTDAPPTAYLLGRLDVRCPRCQAAALLPCRNVRTGEVLLYSYHRKRTELAASAAQADTVTQHSLERPR